MMDTRNSYVKLSYMLTQPEYQLTENQFKSLKRAPAYILAEQAIRTMILDGTLGPGDLLPGEHDLAEQLGITRPTVREAIRKLESSGLVERGYRRRMQVAAPATEVSSSAIRHAIVLHGVTYRELWEVSNALEPTAARLAAARADESILVQIEENLARTRACLNNPKELVQADMEFHELIAEASGNHALQLAREPLGEFLSAAYGVVTKKVGPGKRLLQAHETIFEAIKMRDPDMAEEWMAKHYRDFLRGCEVAGINVDDTVSKVNKKWKIENR